MDSQKILLSVIAFAMSFVVGITSVSFFGPLISEKKHDTVEMPLNPTGGGSSSCDHSKSEFDVPNTTAKRSGLKILSKPHPRYTDEARNALTTGTVILKVELLANGKIGNIEVIKGLPNGLTERAVEAAKSIEFTPLMKDGKPVTVKRSVEYKFTIF